MSRNVDTSTPASVSLEDYLAHQVTEPVPTVVAQLAAAARKRHERGGGVLAVLAYGSALRDADPAETLVDLYVLTADFEAVSDSWLLRWGCRLVPPNVHYLEIEDGNGRRWRAKYACLPLHQFARWMMRDVRNPYFWARFSQPVRLVWVRDDAAKAQVVSALAASVHTMCGIGKGLLDERTGRKLEPQETDCLRCWEKALVATYGSELRVEGPDRARLIVESHRSHLMQLCTLLKAEGDVAPISRHWWLVRLSGKGWSVLRLLKAAFTFSGGADYLAWKIERHTGVKVQLTSWQRRHPVLAYILLFPKLLRKGAVR